MTAARLPVRFYNCAPPSEGRGSTRLARELDAIVDDKPVLLGCCETMGYSMPALRGYQRFRDISTPGRANITAYVRMDYPVTRSQWFDMNETWRRTEHPGTHPARSWLELRFGGMQVLVGHQPPKLPPRSGGPEVTRRIQQEGIDFLTERMAPWSRPSWRAKSQKQRTRAVHRPRIAVADWNRGPSEEGPGQMMLAKRINAAVVGSHIDGLVVRGASAIGAGYNTTWEGVRLGTDHPWGAFRADVQPISRWQG